MNSGRRSYVMTARAESAEETAQRIIDAITGLFVERPLSRITLREVADRAGVSVQTVIRRFGDKDGLVAAAAAHGSAAVAAQRGTATPGDVPGAVDVLLDHYDAFAGVSLRLLAEEESSPSIAAITRQGRQLHREWCERVFAPFLDHLDTLDRDRRVAQLVAICDVYTWQLLHQHSGLDREQVRLALLELLIPLTARSA